MPLTLPAFFRRAAFPWAAARLPLIIPNPSPIFNLFLRRAPAADPSRACGGPIARLRRAHRALRPDGLPAQGNGFFFAREKSRHCDTRPESLPHGSLSFLSRGLRGSCFGNTPRAAVVQALACRAPVPRMGERWCRRAGFILRTDEKSLKIYKKIGRESL